MSSGDAPSRFVSRGGDKLAAALREFAVDAAGLVCIDFGSHVGGFVDCLLQHRAARVYAVDPGYGVLHSTLRSDSRVVSCERANALTWSAPEPADLLTIDAGWTPQRLILAAARRALKPQGRVISLVKPQYEVEKRLLRYGVVPDEQLDAVLVIARADVAGLGWKLLREMESPLRGHGGNREFLWLLAAE